jgi:hypothetical protein
MMDFMDKALARSMARRVCSFIVDHHKRILCINLLTKAFIYGDSVKDEVRSVMEREFTEEERKQIRERLAELMG